MELQQLENLAKAYVQKQHGSKFHKCNTLYRNKPQVYWNDIFNNRGGIMEKYIKDFHGDKACPINGRIDGLFFNTSCDPQTGQPPLTSQYGETRISLLPARLFNNIHNLYLSDFYCIKLAHYVTLVITIKGSESDLFCQNRLIQLNPQDNPYFCVTQTPLPAPYLSSLHFRVTHRVWVEILYTEDINLHAEIRHGAIFSRVTSTGTSTPSGKPKNPDCKVCNLPLPHRPNNPLF